MNATALLALIADLYAQVSALADENRKLRETLAAMEVQVAPPAGAD